MQAPVWHEYPSTPELDAALACWVAAQLDTALAERAGAGIALSGGRTPAGFLRTLGQQPLDWAHIDVTLADERQVAADHPDSNARLLNETLLQGPAAAARFTPLFSDADPSGLDARLAGLHWPLDIVVLGMGDDGHTASLFPQAPQLAHACTTRERWASISPVTASHERITLSLDAIASARCLIIHITGNGKRKLLEQAILDNIQPLPLPIRRVMDAHTNPAHVFWAP